MKIGVQGFRKLSDATTMDHDIEKKDANESTDSDDSKVTRKRTFRETARAVVTSNKFHIVIVALVIVDALIVVAELLIELKVFQQHPPAESTATHSKSSAVSGTIPHVLHYISLSILSLFLVEIAFRIFALRCEFFRHKLEIFDAVVVIVSFVLDVVYHDSIGVQNSASLIVILRLWRVTRIINSIVLSVQMQAEKKLRHERNLREACEHELAKFREYCSIQEEEIEQLRGILRTHGIDYPEDVTKPVAASRIDVVADVSSNADVKLMTESDLPTYRESQDLSTNVVDS